jgi:tetratricopeptide (TPR) repeat protein
MALLQTALRTLLAPALALGAALLTSCAGHRAVPLGAVDAVRADTVAVVHDSLSYEEQQRYDAYYLEAVCQRLQGNYTAAYCLLVFALRCHPNAPEAIYELGLLCYNVDGLAGREYKPMGEACLRKAIALAPDNVDFKERLAMELIKQQRYDEAVPLYQEIVTAAPTVQRLDILVRLQGATHQPAAAIETLNRLEKLEGKSEESSVEKFNLYVQLGDNEHAYAAIEDLCAEYPADLRYRVLLGDLYQQNGYNEMALAIYRDVLTAEPDNSYGQLSLLAYYHEAGEDSLYRRQVREVVLNSRIDTETRVEAMRGFVLEEIKGDDDSIAVLDFFREALEQPQDSRAMAELCAQYMMAKEMPAEQMEPVMEKMLAVEPDYDEARLTLLQILLKKEDYKRLATLCHEGHLYSPSTLAYYYYEGVAHLMNDENAAAVEAFREGTDYIADLSDPDDTDQRVAAELYVALGDVYHAMGQQQETYAAYEKALSYDANHLTCLNNYAYYLCLEKKRLGEAAAMSRRTIEAEPDNATYLDTYASILLEQQKYAQARLYIDRALQQLDDDTDAAVILTHAGDIYYYCHRPSDALKFWIRALAQTSPSDESYALLKLRVKRRRP